MTTTARPTIVCLCGSTRFSDAFQKANLLETLAGNIVLTIGCDLRSDTVTFRDLSDEQRAEIKASLDELHLRKIDLADEVLILNVNGYIGESTRRELAYANEHGKRVRFLETAIPKSWLILVQSDQRLKVELHLWHRHQTTGNDQVRL